MRSEEIRQRFLAFFEGHGHAVVRSASLVADDPTLLLVNAGMVPFKPYFLGEQGAPFPRATSVQKCVRTVDIDQVGQTARHASFFQMNGNFSFGDYFKERAIPYAWELLTGSTGDGGFGFDPDRLWATVYHDDDEAAEIWQRAVGLAPERIQRRGMADNFWSMGVPGPCGPCSEIYYDRGPEFGSEGGPEADEERYLEVWNLVFMQFERGEGEGKEFPIVGELPAKNIDTGMGLERMAALLQGVDNIYEIDISRPVLDRAAALAGVGYGARHDHDVRLRVVTDHVRTSAMLVSDGVTPSNEGRGYVLRRMLRRAVRNMRLLGYEEPALPELLPVVRDCLAPSYPELETDYDRIAGYLITEEEAFLTTLRQGTTILDTAVRETREAGASVLPGARAFQLHDTYGFPIDLTLEMAAEKGLTVDETEFRRLMSEQRARAQADRSSKGIGHEDVSVYRALLDIAGPATFTGYEEVERESTVRGVLGEDGVVDAAGPHETVWVALDLTPFYAEAGGQLADSGRVVLPDGELEIVDVQTPMPGLVLHRARVVRGEVRTGQTVYAVVDAERRRSISRSHTATHMVHTAMRRALGESATQAGSLNAPGRLRFDFKTPAAVPTSVLADVESEVNEMLLRDLDVRAFVTSMDEARRLGAMALFGEKYGDRVRIVEVGDYARELCGGTHVARSSQLGMVKLVTESSIGSGVRRVEGLVGMDAFQHLAREHVVVSQLSELLRVPSAELPDRVAATLERMREVEKELESLRATQVMAGSAALAEKRQDVAGITVVAERAPDGIAANPLRKLVREVLHAGPNGPGPVVVALVSVAEERAQLVVATSPAARERGLSAKDLVRSAAGALGGGGGGNDEVAQGGGQNPQGAEDALRLVTRRVAEVAG